MAESYHVNGVCLVTIGGTAIGYSTPEGCKVEIIRHKLELKADLLGPELPGEIVNLGSEARVTMELALYDPSNWASVLANADYGTRGSMGTIGQFTLDTGASPSTYTQTLKLGSPIDLEYWNFTTAYMVDSMETTLAVGVQKTYLTEWRCLPNNSGVCYTITSS